MATAVCPDWCVWVQDIANIFVLHFKAEIFPLLNWWARLVAAWGACTRLQCSLLICCLASNNHLRHLRDTTEKQVGYSIYWQHLCAQGSARETALLTTVKHHLWRSHKKWHFSVPVITHSFHGPVHVTAWFGVRQPALQRGASSCNRLSSDSLFSPFC